MVGKLRELNPNESLHAFYGWEVRRWRTKAGVSLTDLSNELRYSKTQISRIEAAERAPSLELSVALDELLSTEGHFARLWPHVDRQAYPHRAKRYMELEQRAARIRKFMPSVMPGLFQTEAYMRALFRDFPVTGRTTRRAWPTGWGARGYLRGRTLRTAGSSSASPRSDAELAGLRSCGSS
jgi:transcriptional regulator with XRE-family HTH domain